MSSEEDKTRFSQKCLEVGSSTLLSNGPINNVVFSDFNTDGSYSKVNNRDDLVAETKKHVEKTSACYVSQELAESVARVVGSLKHPQGHALLLGAGGSGRHTVARLASSIAGLELRQIAMTNSYSLTSWREDLRKILISAGSDNQAFALLLSDSQLSEQMLEDIDHIFTSGSVPFLFDLQEAEALVN